MTEWCGQKIIDYLIIKDNKLIIGENSITIIYQNMGNFMGTIDILTIINYILKMGEIKDVFGILVGPSTEIVKKKIKTNLITEFTEASLNNILSTNNQDTYYNFNGKLEQVIGLEIRFKNEAKEWFNKEKMGIEIITAIREKKKRIFEGSA